MVAEFAPETQAEHTGMTNGSASALPFVFLETPQGCVSP